MWGDVWGCSLELSDDKLVLEMQELAHSALSWESKAAHALKLGDSYANVHELLGCVVLSLFLMWCGS